MTSFAPITGSFPHYGMSECYHTVSTDNGFLWTTAARWVDPALGFAVCSFQLFPILFSSLNSPSQVGWVSDLMAWQVSVFSSQSTDEPELFLCERIKYLHLNVQLNGNADFCDYNACRDHRCRCSNRVLGCARMSYCGSCIPGTRLNFDSEII